MTVDDVESVIYRAWTVDDRGGGSCIYYSDRGAVFGIQPVADPPDELTAALGAARVYNCDTKPRDVPHTGRAFACVEQTADGDLVEGHIVAQGYFWLLVTMGTGPDRDYPEQMEAMAALLGAVNR